MRGLKIKYKIAYALILLLICFGIVNTTVYYLKEYKSGIEDYKITGTSIIKNVAPDAADHLYTNDIVGVQRTIDLILENNKDIVYVFVLNPRNEIVAHTFQQNFPSDLLQINTKPQENIELLDFGDKTVYDFSYPIVDGKLGIIRIGISRERMIRNLRSSLSNMIILLLAFIGIGIFVALYVGKLITNPLDELIKSVEKISRGNYKHSLKIRSKDEIGSLSTSFNTMCNNLQNLTDKLEEKITMLYNKNTEYEALNKKYKIQNKDLLNAKEKAEESDRLKSAFLANLSHEIRTPMNGILGFAQLLKESNLSKIDQKKYISIIVKSGERMLKLINDLVDISKIEAGQVELNSEKTDLNLLLDRLYTFFKFPAKTKGIKLEYERPLKNDESLILTDSVKLEGIFTNLLNNALKYTDKGKISFGYNVIKNKIKCWVRDTGKGIPPDMKEVIFERFRQANDADFDSEEGSGLGLAICKAYIELMGGEIWFESKLAQGSTFYFTLPYYKVNRAKETIDHEDEFLKNCEDMTVLVADDDEASFSYLNEILINYHIRVLHAYNGKEVLNFLNVDQSIKLILMDLKMPGLNGLDAASEIRKNNRKIPIIAQTAYTSDSTRQKALLTGCNDFIAKPINKKELLMKINSVL